jgi:hypothetical protein
MRIRGSKRGLAMELVFILLILVFSILLTGWTFNIKPQYWLSTPLNSYGDGQLLEFLLQNQFINNSTLFGIDKISNIGWPGGTFLELYPQNDELFVYIISIFYNLFNLSIPISIMVLVLIKFPLASISFYLLIRLLGVSRVISAGSSIAFAFIPYSLIRAEGHLMLAQIWVIPLATALPLFFYLKFPKSLAHSSQKLFLFALLIFSGLMTGFAGSYYFVYSLILAFSFFLVDTFKFFSSTNSANLDKHLLTKRRQIRLDFKSFILNRGLIYFLYFFVSVFSFFISSYDNITAERSVTNIFLIRDARVPIESLIYSGNFLSLFSDLYVFIDKIFQTNFIGLASQYYSWESFGLGPYFTVFATMSIVIFLIKRIDPKTIFSDPGRKLLFPLALFIWFYYQGLGGFLVAEFITPSLRAWGRISIYIAFLSLIAFSINLNYFSRNRFQLFKQSRTLLLAFSVLSVYILLWNLLYIKDYNFNRPSRETIVSTFESEKQYNDEIIQTLRANLTAGCPIVVLPVYRFPEYNPPLDRLADNDLLSISLADTKSEFKWNSGNVKWSEGEQYWAPLANDIPPFANASLETQIGYANQYGACAIALNQGMFESEKSEVSADFLSNLNCPLIIDKRGASASSSWLIWDIRDPVCSSNIVKLAALDAESFPKSNEKPVLWRYTNISPEFFVKNVGIFNGRSDVNLDFVIEENQFKNSTPNLKLGILNGELAESYNLQVCITSYQKVKVSSNCQNVKIANDKTVKLELNKYMNSNKYKLEITPTKLTSEYNWSLLWTYERN